MGEVEFCAHAQRKGAGKPEGAVCSWSGNASEGGGSA